MKKRKLVIFALAMGLLCSLALPGGAEEAGYPDTQGHYAQVTIDTWSGYGVLKGYPDGTFQPNGTITRAELAVVLDRVMGYRNETENVYSDLPAGKWYTDSVLHLAAQGIFNGDGKGQMSPAAPITRQEAFAALARAFDLEESGRAPGFADDGAISGWAMGYIAAMREAGYVNGDKNGNVRPNDPITRAEVVATLDRMIPAFVNGDGTYSEDCGGNLVVNAQDVTLKDMTVGGDLIVADGVADGDVYLDGVTVEGTVVLRGCGENSFHILSGSEVSNIIVAKSADGVIRVVNESGKDIPLVEVRDGSDGVVLEGGLQEVEIAAGVNVTFGKGGVEKLYVTASNVTATVGKGSKVEQMDVASEAINTEVVVEGELATLVANAAANVTNNGKISAVKAQASGLVLDGKKPATVTIAKGVDAPVDAKGNKIVTSASDSSSRGSSGSSGGSSSGGSTPTPTPTPEPTPTPTPEPCKHTHIKIVPEECKAATCAETGLSVVGCTDCGGLIKETIELRNHKYGTWSFWVEDGDMKLWLATCTVCGKEGEAMVMGNVDPNKVTEGDQIDGYIPGLMDPEPKGCKYHQIEMVGDYEYSNNCTHRSWTEVCKICGVTTHPVEIVHDIFAGWHIWEIVTPQKDPTCTENGVMAVQRCKRCGSEISSDYTGSNTIPALGHSYGEWVNDRVNNSRTRTCEVCGAVDKEENVIWDDE